MIESRVGSWRHGHKVDSVLPDAVHSRGPRTGGRRFVSIILWGLIYGGWVWLMILGSQELYRDAMVPPGEEVQVRMAQAMGFFISLSLYACLVSGVLAILAWWWHERRIEVVVVIGLTLLFVFLVVYTNILDGFVTTPIIEEYRTRLGR